MRIVWTEPALRDLDAARAYIVSDNTAAANKQVEYVMTALLRLADFPESGRPGRDVLEILRVLHERQRWPDGF